ncbi:hypothetical protein [Bacillus toyonensis]|uniref:hypothetical protein n=1 Tax=Bacillus toyonensis TaxID=155322 RepID=UPI00159BE772|nr:hypothetical protein [Bacillus toyonensis]
MNNIKVILTLNLFINLILFLSILLLVKSTVIGIIMIFIFVKKLKDNENGEPKNKDAV